MKSKSRPSLASKGPETSVVEKTTQLGGNVGVDINDGAQRTIAENSRNKATDSSTSSKRKKLKRHKAIDATLHTRKKRKLNKAPSSISPANSSLKTSNASIIPSTPSSPSVELDVKARSQDVLEERQCLSIESLTGNRRLKKSHLSVDSISLLNAKPAAAIPASLNDEVGSGQHQANSNMDFEDEAETDSYETAPEPEPDDESELPTPSTLSKLKSPTKEKHSQHLSRMHEQISPPDQGRPQLSLSGNTTSSCGRISNEDIKIITNVIVSFRDQKNMAQHELNQIIQKDANKSQESRELWSFVHEHIPTIPKQKLINICRRKFHNFEARGAWTPSQDEELSAIHEMYPGKWKKIGEILNRFPQDCRDRWRNYLVCGEKMRKDTWELEEEKMLRRTVNEFLDNYHKKHGETDIDDNLLIDWQTISKMMGHTRSRLQCSMKWRIIKDRYESGNERSSETPPLSRTPWRLEGAEKKVQGLSSDEKLQLLYAIREYDVQRESKIPWTQFQKQNTGVVGSKLELRVIFSNLKKSVPNHETMKLKEIVQYLIDTIENSIQKDSEKKSRISSKKSRKEKSRSQRLKQKHSSVTASPPQVDEESSSSQLTSPRSSKELEILEVSQKNTTSSQLSRSKNSKNLHGSSKVRSKATRKLDDAHKSSKVEKRKGRERKESDFVSKAPLRKAKINGKSKRTMNSLSEERVVDSEEDG